MQNALSRETVPYPPVPPQPHPTVDKESWAGGLPLHVFDLRQSTGALQTCLATRSDSH
jgi:hypothetical protein